MNVETKFGELSLHTEQNMPTVAPAPAEAATSLLQVIERVAMNPHADLDKMKQLLDMRNGEMAREAIMAFNAAMAEAQREMEPVARDAKNQQTNSNYARLEAIARAITPIRAKHGFAASFGTDDCPHGGFMRVTCELSHNAGHSKHFHADIPIDSAGMAGKVNKTPTHAFGSTMSYGRRYLTLMIFDIATEDDDGNRAGSGTVISDEQATDLLNLINEVGADKAKFLAYMRVDSIADIPVAKLGGAIAKLEAKRAQS